MEKLIVKNFGAIHNIAIDIKDLMIFIGETGTGKSTLAKLISIFRSPDFWLDKIFSEKLNYYQIDSFLEEPSYMQYQSEVGIFTYDKEKADWHFSESMLSKMVKFARIQNKDISIETTNIIEELLRIICDEVIYIPAERGVVSFLSEKYAVLDGRKLTGLFPNTLLSFTARFNEVSFIIRRLFIDLFKITYQKDNGKDYVISPNDKRFLLSESASGLQTLVPTLLLFEYFASDKGKKSYTFEEPELNLFPIAQKLLVELITEKVLNNGHKMVITTHSPYILTALNNLIYAYQVGQKEPDKVKALIEQKMWLNPQNIGAYFMEDGIIRSIVSEELRQTKAEEIDKVSDLINSLYDALLEIKISDEDSDIQKAETMSTSYDDV